MLTAASRALDLAVVARLSLVGVEKPAAIDLRPVDPHAFWAESRVRDPRPVSVAATFTPFEGPDWRELDLVGESEGPGAHPGARRVTATAHVRRGRPDLPAVLLVHGYAVPFTGFDRWLAWRMRRRGAHTVRMELPYHLRRSEPGRASGDGFFSIDPAHTRAVVRQAVEDAAALLGWMRRELSPVVSVVGTSLGGLVATLLAAQVEVDSLLGIAPLCDPAASFVLRPPLAVQRRMGMLGAGESFWGSERSVALPALSAALAPLKPARFEAATPGSRTTLVLAENDLIVGPEPVAELATAWQTEVWRYPHGHITVMNAPGMGSRVVERAVDGRPEARPAMQLAG